MVRDAAWKAVSTSEELVSGSTPVSSVNIKLNERILFERTKTKTTNRRARLKCQSKASQKMALQRT